MAEGVVFKLMFVFLMKLPRGVTSSGYVLIRELIPFAKGGIGYSICEGVRPSSFF